MSAGLTLTALDGLPIVGAGDDLSRLITCAARRQGIVPENGDVFVVAQKIVSKAEGRTVRLRDVVPSARALALAEEVGKDPRLVELILSESTEVVRHARDVLIVAHRAGFVMANAGIDQSNVAFGTEECALLLPCDPDASAATLRGRLEAELGVEIGVVINDSFGRPWRQGVVGVALGAAGVPSLVNLVGTPDIFGRPMQVTEVAVADQLAAAASLLMGECDERRPAVHIRGTLPHAAPSPAASLIRPRNRDLFR